MWSSATAASLFRRFYMRQSIASRDPHVAVAAVVYLSGKVDECKCSAQKVIDHLTALCEYDYAEIFSRITVSKVLHFELQMIEKLGFDLLVHSPYPSLLRFFNAAEGIPSAAVGQNVLRASRDIINDAMLYTDLALTHPPHVTALAALCVACITLDCPVGEWVNTLNVGEDILASCTRRLLQLFKNPPALVADKVQPFVIDLYQHLGASSKPGVRSAPPRGSSEMAAGIRGGTCASSSSYHDGADNAADNSEGEKGEEEEEEEAKNKKRKGDLLRHPRQKMPCPSTMKM